MLTEGGVLISLAKDSRLGGSHMGTSCIFHSWTRCIRTIEEKFRSKIFYLNPKVFKDNFFLMIKNCQWYNGNFHSISFYSSEVEKIHIALSKIV